MSQNTSENPQLTLTPELIAQFHIELGLLAQLVLKTLSFDPRYPTKEQLPEDEWETQLIGVYAALEASTKQGSLGHNLKNRPELGPEIKPLIEHVLAEFWGLAELLKDPQGYYAFPQETLGHLDTYIDNTYRKILYCMAVLHDLGKIENANDPQHPQKSVLFARAFFQVFAEESAQANFDLSDGLQQEEEIPLVEFLIANHHVYQEIKNNYMYPNLAMRLNEASAQAKQKLAEQTAVIMARYQDQPSAIGDYRNNLLRVVKQEVYEDLALQKRSILAEFTKKGYPPIIDAELFFTDHPDLANPHVLTMLFAFTCSDIYGLPEYFFNYIDENIYMFNHLMRYLEMKADPVSGLSQAHKANKRLN